MAQCRRTSHTRHEAVQIRSLAHPRCSSCCPPATTTSSSRSPFRLPAHPRGLAGRAVRKEGRLIHRRSVGGVAAQPPHVCRRSWGAADHGRGRAGPRLCPRARSRGWREMRSRQRKGVLLGVARCTRGVGLSPNPNTVLYRVGQCGSPLLKLCVPREAKLARTKSTLRFDSDSTVVSKALQLYKYAEKRSTHLHNAPPPA